MAKIVLNETAPKDAKSFSLANENFEVPFETTDSVVLANAASHPWLSVERDANAEAGGEFADRQVRPEDDPLSALNDRSNDADYVREQREEAEEATPLAVDAGLDQDEAQSVGEGDHKVNVTLAADDTDSTEAAPKRARRSNSDKDKE